MRFVSSTRAIVRAVETGGAVGNGWGLSQIGSYIVAIGEVKDTRVEVCEVKRREY